MAKTSPCRAKHISPISSLPDRLLLVILIAVVDNVYSSDHELRLDCVILGNVCRGWRSLVLSTSRFWTRLHIILQLRLGPLSRVYLERNMKRSGNALVDVVIYVARPPHYYPWVKKCLEMLRECSHRWRSLRIIKEDTCHTDLFHFVLSELGFPYGPALKKVEIICHNSDSVTLVKESFQFLSSTSTPSLKTLTLEGCDSNILQHFDASSLTHLSLSKCSYISSSLIIFRNLLSSAQNLVSLELHQRVVLVEQAEADGILCPVILPTLRTLSIIMGAEKPAYLSGILNTIATPNLHHLAVYGDSLTSWDQDSLPDFSSPAFFLWQDQTPMLPSVRKLTMKNILQSMHGPGKDIHSIFTAFPYVTEVVLDHDIWEIADQLALESYEQKALPPWTCLRQLTIEMPSMTKFHYLPQLSEWLRLRRAGKLPLPAVVIRCELQRAGVMRDTRDSTAIKRIVNDATGYRTSDTRDVVKQLGRLRALVDLKVNSWTK
ncbi:hypothetical protein DFH29DRAFT_913343 [Suillus ampliporus]|nr:hypothetical protein DFH29DRAFT_913343 [Suillus ampliporus]